MTLPAARPFEADRVVRIAHADLRASSSHWPWARDHQDAIDAHWQQESRRNANYFNGTVYLIDGLDLNEAVQRASATFTRTDFKSYLYWRDLGYPEAGVLDGFGSALIRSSDGAVILGRQKPGNINSGLVYLPGGFIDARDADREGRIDIAASVLREAAEETGLDAGSLTAEPGFYLTVHRAHVSFALPLVSKQPVRELLARIDRHIAAETAPELAEVIAVNCRADLEGLAMPGYARALLMILLD